MITPSVRCGRFWGCSALLTLAACAPSERLAQDKVAALRAGMPRDSVLAILGTGSLVPLQPSDSLRLLNGFRQEQFYANGGLYQIIWYRDTPGALNAPISRRTDTPVLLEEDEVVATGWAEFDRATARLNVPNPYRRQNGHDAPAGDR